MCCPLLGTWKGECCQSPSLLFCTSPVMVEEVEREDIHTGQPAVVAAKLVFLFPGHLTWLHLVQPSRRYFSMLVPTQSSTLNFTLTEDIGAVRIHLLYLSETTRASGMVLPFLWRAAPVNTAHSSAPSLWWSSELSVAPMQISLKSSRHRFQPRK